MVNIDTNVTIITVVLFLILFLFFINIVVAADTMNILKENQKRKQELFFQRVRTQMLLRENIRREDVRREIEQKEENELL